MGTILEEGVTAGGSSGYPSGNYYLLRAWTVPYAWTGSSRMKRLSSWHATKRTFTTRHVSSNGSREVTLPARTAESQ